MTDPMILMNRRRWLARSSLGLAGALGVGTLGNLLLGAKPAYAADYKALLCIFLYGGNDGLNTVVPTDAARYNQYAAVRGKLAIPSNRLVPLAGMTYGLHPALAGLQAAADDGHVAPVFNVGPLIKPLTKAEFRAASSSVGVLPDSLYSHSDQQYLWENGTGDSLEPTGWGGRASDALATVNPVISLNGTPRFGISRTHTPLVLPNTPGDTFGAFEMQPDDLKVAWKAERKAAIDAMYREQQELALANAYTAIQRDAFNVSDRLSGLVKIVPGGAGATAAIDTAFAPLISGGKIGTGLGRQLYQIAKLVSGNATVQGNRQIFFAQMSAFDTHGNQAVDGSPADGQHAQLLKELGDALGAFYRAMKALGLGESVTAFTQSDFGRTFVPNNSMGTDHAWGNNHLVVGGAVKGGRGYGSYPDLTLGGPNDVGVDTWEQQGRWIPTSSVDQYAATMLGWFGASDAQLRTVLPNLANFGTATKLGFV